MMSTKLTQRYTLLAVASVFLGCCDVDAVPCDVSMSVDGQHAQCRQRRLTMLPDTVPDGVVSLDMSSNFLASLTGLAVPKLGRLRYLNVSRNVLTSLPIDAFRCVPHVEELDLGYNHLKALPEDVFRGLKNLTVLTLTNTDLHVLPDLVFKHVTQLTSLDLSSNSFSAVPTVALQQLSQLQLLNLNSNGLKTLDNHSLSSLHDLRSLSLSENRLSKLQPATFSGLHRLTSLDISVNQLTLNDESYPPDVFSPLVALESLRLHGNDYRGEGEYPLNVFDPLKSLQDLSIDTFNDPHFGPAFSALTQLTSLTLASDGCNMKRISNRTFSAFRGSGLQVLYIINCPLMNMETCAFCDLPHLTNLTVSVNEYLKLPLMLLALYGLQNQTMKLVDFSFSRQYPSVLLDETNTVYLNNVCIEKLDLHYSLIDGISSRAIRLHTRFVMCLKHIDLSENRFSSLDRNIYLKMCIGLKNIESFEMQTQISFRLKQKSHESTHPRDEQPRANITLYVSTAPSLTLFNASAGIGMMGELPAHVHFLHGGNMTVLDLSYVRAFDCRTSITGLSNLRTFDFSGNDCSSLSVHFFQHLTTLRHLLIANVNLQDDFMLAHGSELLRPLEDLEELSLAENNLLTLPRHLLHSQPRLRRLDLSGNRFLTVPVDVERLNELSELDMSNNMITTLPLSLTHRLDQLAANHTVTLRLRGNPLACTCHALDLVSWLAETAVRLDGANDNTGFDDDYDDNGRDFPCMLENGSMSSTGRVMGEWDGHWRGCVGLGALTVATAGLLTELLVLLLTYVLWRNWTYVRYAWRVLRRLRPPRRVDFDHDALIVHADADLELAMRVKRLVTGAHPDAEASPLRLALPMDVMPAGALYAEELAEHMERSWKIVVLLTQHYLQDRWAGFTAQQAQRGISDTTPGRVIVLFNGLQPPRLQEVVPQRPSSVSLKCLLRMIPESLVYHVPSGRGVRHHPMWAAVAQRIARDME